MKKLIFLLAILFSFSAFAQNKARVVPLFTNFLFDSDTTVLVPCVLDYRYVLEVQATSLTGAYTGTISFKHNLTGFTGTPYITEDTTKSIYVINSANYVQSFTFDGTKSDVLIFKFTKNGNTGGRLKATLKMFENRD